MDFIQTYCVLDEGDRLLCVGGDWDAFAEENGGADCTGANVAGKHYFSGIEGFETRSFLNAATFAVRDRKRQFVMDYRCDSPVIRRFMRLTVSPLRHNRLLMVHDFLHEEKAGDPGPVWLFAPDAKVRKCSVCCSVEFGEVWMDPYLSKHPRPQFVTYTMCPKCRKHAADSLSVASTPMRLETKVVRFSRRAGGAKPG
ncbi:MAG: hypothetical protein ACKVPY_00465 [Paracoccaceae bacterium]